MCNKNALKGFSMGMLAAMIVVLGSASVLAHQADQDSVSADHALAPQADGQLGFGDPFSLVVPGAAFTSDGIDPDGHFFSFGGGYVNGVGTACLKAPAYLPNGAVVTDLYASIYDNAAGNVTVQLARVNRISGATNAMASASTTSDSTSIQNRYDSSIDYPQISYPDYAYYLITCLNDADHRVYSVRIYYRGPYFIYLPLVLKTYLP
jgi:hypothetical protein